MQNLILVRNGESAHHVRGLTGGWTDTPLTEHGKRQAECVGRSLANSGTGDASRIFSSDLLRARHTADVIAAHTGASPIFREELRELNNGVVKDKSLDEARKLELPMTMPTIEWAPYPGAESWKAMSLRVMRFMDELAGSEAGETTLIVSHGNAMIAVVHWWLRLDERYWSTVSYELDCASITRLTINRWGERTISKLNDTSHLQ